MADAGSASISARILAFQVSRLHKRKKQFSGGIPTNEGGVQYKIDDIPQILRNVRNQIYSKRLGSKPSGLTTLAVRHFDLIHH